MERSETWFSSVLFTISSYFPLHYVRCVPQIELDWFSSNCVNILLTNSVNLRAVFNIDASPTDAAAVRYDSKLILWFQLPPPVPDWECAEAFYWPCVAPHRHKVRHQCAVYDLRVLLGL